MKKTKKGFTLIELLSVIAILAIIAVIAIPTILGTIEKFKKEAARSSVYGYLRAIENTVSLSRLDYEKLEIIDGIYEVDDLEVDIEGETPSEGWYVIQKDKVTSYKLKSGKWWFSSGEKPDIKFQVIGNCFNKNNEKYYYDEQIIINIFTPNYIFTNNDVKNFNDLIDEIEIKIDGQFLQQEEINSIKAPVPNLYIVKLSQAGLHTIDVETTYNGRVSTKSIDINIDNMDPDITIKDNPKLLDQRNYDFSDNITVSFGLSGGEVTCVPNTSLKEGVYDVSCRAESNNGKFKETIFQVKHSYEAQATTNTTSVRCGHWDALDGSAGGGTCSYKRFRCNVCGQETLAYTCSQSDGSGWGNGDHYRDVTTTTYSCPNGGTLSGTICNY